MVQEKKAKLVRSKKEVISLSPLIKIAIIGLQTQTTHTRYELTRPEVKTLKSLTVFPFVSSL